MIAASSGPIASASRGAQARSAVADPVHADRLLADRALVVARAPRHAACSCTRPSSIGIAPNEMISSLSGSSPVSSRSTAHQAAVAPGRSAAREFGGGVRRSAGPVGAPQRGQQRRPSSRTDVELRRHTLLDRRHRAERLPQIGPRQRAERRRVDEVVGLLAGAELLDLVLERAGSVISVKCVLERVRVGRRTGFRRRRRRAVARSSRRSSRRPRCRPSARGRRSGSRRRA